MTGQPNIEGYSIGATLDVDDIKSYIKSRPDGRRRLPDLLLRAGIAFFMLVTMMVVGSVFGEALPGIVSAALVGLGLEVALRRNTRRNFERVADKFVPYELHIGRTGVVQRVGRTEVKYAWNEVESVMRNSESVEVRTWDGELFYLPRRAFVDEVQFEGVFELASEMHKLVQIGHG